MSATHEPILFEKSLGSPAKVHVKNLNHITEVLSTQTPGPGSRTRRFSRFAVLRLAFTLLANFNDQPGTINIFSLFSKERRCKKRELYIERDRSHTSRD